jgi:hypothetical protein
VGLAVGGIDVFSVVAKNLKRRAAILADDRSG